VATTDLQSADPIAVALIISLVLQEAWSAFQWAVGLFGLAASAYGVYKDCYQQYNTRECILASVGLATSGLVTKYKYTSGLRYVL
jgi:hypothetical protein